MRQAATMLYVACNSCRAARARKEDRVVPRRRTSSSMAVSKPPSMVTCMCSATSCSSMSATHASCARWQDSAKNGITADILEGPRAGEAVTVLKQAFGVKREGLGALLNGLVYRLAGGNAPRKVGKADAVWAVVGLVDQSQIAQLVPRRTRSHVSNSVVMSSCSRCIFRSNIAATASRNLRFVRNHSLPAPFARFGL